MATLFYRIIDNHEPVTWYFMSNFARGKAPRRSEITNPASHRAVSMFSDLDGARYVQSRFPRMGRYIAVVDIDLAGGAVSVESDSDPTSTHCELTAEPITLLGCVREVLGPF